MRYLLIAVIFFMLSCSKEKSCGSCMGNDINANAIILDGGQDKPYGCGWLVQINGTVRYHPAALDLSFQHDNLAVKIIYQLTSDTLFCGDFALARIPVIHINSISKR